MEKIIVCLEEAVGIKEDLMAKGFEQNAVKKFLENNFTLTAEGTGSKLDGVIKAGKVIGNFVSNHAVGLAGITSFIWFILALRKNAVKYKAYIEDIRVYLGAEIVVEYEKLWDSSDELQSRIEDLSVQQYERGDFSNISKMNALNIKYQEQIARMQEIDDQVKLAKA